MNLVVQIRPGLAVSKTVTVRSFRFHGFTRTGAAEMAVALNEDGMTAEVVAPHSDTSDWGVVANGDDRSEGLLEMLAQFYGGSYEGEDLAGA